MNNFDTTQITLKYLANNIYQETMNKTKDENEILERKEIKFYKKRIYTMFKEMIKGKYPNDTLKEKYDEYVKSIIEYIKFTDKYELIQQDYKQLDDCESSLDDDVSLNKFKDEYEANSLDINKKMMNIKPEGNNSLDNFVQIKKVKINTNEKDVIPFPKIKNINIKSNDYRTKGVKTKNNIQSEKSDSLQKSDSSQK